MEEDKRNLYEEIVLGEEVEVWLKSPIGQFVMRQKQEVEKRIMEEFRKVDPEDASSIRLLQRALDAADTGPKWLIDQVHIAHQQEQILSAEEVSRE